MHSKQLSCYREWRKNYRSKYELRTLSEKHYCRKCLTNREYI